MMSFYSKKQNEFIKNNFCNVGFMNPIEIPDDTSIRNGSGILAICIPTYNHANIIEELLETELEEFKKNNFDLYIYDSSEGFATKEIVEKWINNYVNLFYVHLPSELHSNMKVYKIYQGYGLKKNYRYLWMRNDTIRYKTCVYSFLLNAMKQSYDIILLNGRDFECLGNKLYTDALNLFKDCGWHMTLYGVTVLNCATMLQDIDWNFLVDKYNIPERVNHSHLCFYFEKLYMMETFRAIHLSLQDLVFSSSKRQFSGWHDNTFYVWGYCFPNAINALPSYYDSGKKIVIKKHGVYGGVFGLNNLLLLRSLGLYDKNIYESFFYDWKFLTDVSRHSLKKIAEMDKQHAYALGNKFNTNIFFSLSKKIFYELNLFVSKHKRLYLFGSGQLLQRYAGYLDSMGWKYDLLVTPDMNFKLKFLFGHKVVNLETLDCNDSSIGIILAGDYNSIEEIKKVYFHFDNNSLFDTYIPCYFLLPITDRKKKSVFKTRLKELYDFVLHFKKLYIYGAGKVAQRYAGYLAAKEIKFEAFLVTNRESDLKILNAHDIISIYDIVLDDDVGIIMGMNLNNIFQARNLSVLTDFDNIFDIYIPEIYLN